MAINKDTMLGTVEDYAGQAQAYTGETFGDSDMEAKGTLNELKGKAQTAFGTAKEKVAEWRDHAPEQVRQVREKAGEYYAQGSEKVRHTVQEQPVATLAGGVALGFLIGWLVSSRKN